MMMMIMMMMMISISIAIGSIDLNDQCPEGDYFFQRKTKKKRRNSLWKTEKLRCTVSPADTEKESQSENR